MKNKFDFKNSEDFCRAELRKIYHSFKFEGLSQEEAERQKKALLIDYRKYLENFDYCRSVWKKYQDNIRVSEMLKTDIQKSHDIREIAETAVRAVGLMTHDESFIKTNLAKLEALK